MGYLNGSMASALSALAESLMTRRSDNCRSARFRLASVLVIPSCRRADGQSVLSTMFRITKGSVIINVGSVIITVGIRV